jgi:hypothetical protein
VLLFIGGWFWDGLSGFGLLFNPSCQAIIAGLGASLGRCEFAPTNRTGKALPLGG